MPPFPAGPDHVQEAAIETGADLVAAEDATSSISTRSTTPPGSTCAGWPPPSPPRASATYCSYIPHGFVANWTRDGRPAAAYGTQLRDPAGRQDPPCCTPLQFHRRMARRAGRNRLRFLPPFLRRQENHIGEVITDEAGHLAYLKTFRLSEGQVRRGHLLTRLAACGWNLADIAAALGVSEAQLGLRIESAGFGHLLRQDVLDRYRAEARRRAGVRPV